MTTYPMIYVLMTTTGYPIFIRNDETPTILFENDYYYNKVHREPIDIFERNNFSDFKSIHVSYGARKYVVVNHDVEVSMKLIKKNTFPQYNYH
jgi:hypothetical protein